MPTYPKNPFTTRRATEGKLSSVSRLQKDFLNCYNGVEEKKVKQLAIVATFFFVVVFLPEICRFISWLFPSLNQ